MVNNLVMFMRNCAFFRNFMTLSVIYFSMSCSPLNWRTMQNPMLGISFYRILNIYSSIPKLIKLLYLIRNLLFWWSGTEVSKIRSQCSQFSAGGLIINTWKNPLMEEWMTKNNWLHISRKVFSTPSLSVLGWCN